MSVAPEQTKAEDWRFLELIRTYTRFKDPLDLDDAEKLSAIVRGKADLHKVQAALERGCSLDTAVAIFT